MKHLIIALTFSLAASFSMACNLSASTFTSGEGALTSRSKVHSSQNSSRVASNSRSTDSNRTQK